MIMTLSALKWSALIVGELIKVGNVYKWFDLGEIRMNFIVPLLIISLSLTPFICVEAVSKKQTIKTEQKKLSSSEQRKAEKLVKKKKCSKAIDTKTKKVYYICEK